MYGRTLLSAEFSHFVAFVKFLDQELISYRYSPCVVLLVVVILTGGKIFKKA